MMYLGDFADNQTIHFAWNSCDQDGESITRAVNGTIHVYKNDAAGTEVTTGVTDTEDFDSLTGVHYCKIVTTDAFYAAGADYTVILKASTIDGETVNAVLAHFSIENRFMRGTNSAALASVCTESRLAELDAANLPADIDDLREIADTTLGAVQNLSATGSALNALANANTTIVTGTETSGTYLTTIESNDVRHVITEVGSTIDMYYEFDVGSDGIPVTIHIEGYLKEGAPPGNDSVTLYAYNWVTTSWELLHVDILVGIVTDGPDSLSSHSLFHDQVGTGGDVGKVRIRFYDNALESGTSLNIDQIYVSYAESYSASIAAILDDTSNMQPKLGTPAADISADIAAPVTLADGAHGGTAATLTLLKMEVDNTNGDGVTFKSSGGNGIGLLCQGEGTGPAIRATSGSGGATGIEIEGSQGDPGLLISGGVAGHGILVGSGSNKSNISGTKELASFAAGLESLLLATVQASPAPTTTEFDTNLTLTNVDQLVNRVIIFRDGNNQYVQAKITASSVTGLITCEELPVSPVAGNTFIVV